ncbi:MAG: SDR family oxidoreductase [Pseudoruegeria sp.]
MAKTALVTGAAKRLGRSMALYLADRGFDVAIHYAGSKDDAEQLASEISEANGVAKTFQADLINEDEIQALFPRVVDAFKGPVTCLVNNASVFEYDNIHTATRNSWDRHLQSNLRAPVVLTQMMAAQGMTATTDQRGEPEASGLVVNMLDQRVRKLTPEFTSYTIAKMALWAFTQTSARALAPHIRVNAIGPGPTLIGANQSQQHFENQRSATVLKRGSNPKDITAALGYFLDAPSVTGQLICTDGGQHLAWQTPDIQDK